MSYPTFDPELGPSYPYPPVSTVLADAIQTDRAYPHVLTKSIRKPKRIPLQWNRLSDDQLEYIMSFLETELEGGMGPFYWTPAHKVPSPSGSAPVLSQVAGGALSGRTYYVRYTWYDSSYGETKQSAQASLAVNANYYLVVTVKPVPNRVSGWRLYAHESSGSECLQDTITTGRTWTQSAALVTGTATPPSTNTLTTPLLWILASQEITPRKIGAESWSLAFDIMEVLF